MFSMNYTRQYSIPLWRLFLTMFVLVGIYILPWWIPLLGMMVLVFRYYAPEVILFGFLFDALYAVSVPAVFGFEYMATLFGFILFWGIQKIKKKILI